MTSKPNQLDRLHIHFAFRTTEPGDEDSVLARLENGLVTWLEEELHWPQPDADGPCVWVHRLDEIPGTRFCPALPWCDSLPREDAENKWSRIVAKLPELQNYREFKAFVFITNANDQDNTIAGFVIQDGEMSEFVIPPREPMRPPEFIENLHVFSDEEFNRILRDFFGDDELPPLL